MKYKDFNGLDSVFEVGPIYFWSCAHQTLLVSTSHPSFTLLYYIILYIYYTYIIHIHKKGLFRSSVAESVKN